VKIDLSPMTSTAYEQDTTLTSIHQFLFGKLEIKHCGT